MSLETYLKENGLTLNALCKRAGVNYSTVWKYLNGKQKSINPHIALKVSKATNGEVCFAKILLPNEEFSVKVVPKND